MSGDAKFGGKCAFEIGGMWSCVDALRGIMIVSSYEEVNFSDGTNGELVTVVCDVVSLCVVRDVVASGCMIGIVQCM